MVENRIALHNSNAWSLLFVYMRSIVNHCKKMYMLSIMFLWKLYYVLNLTDLLSLRLLTTVLWFVYFFQTDLAYSYIDGWPHNVILSGVFLRKNHSRFLCIYMLNSLFLQQASYSVMLHLKLQYSTVRGAGSPSTTYQLLYKAGAFYNSTRKYD